MEIQMYESLILFRKSSENNHALNHSDVRLHRHVMGQLLLLLLRGQVSSFCDFRSQLQIYQKSRIIGCVILHCKLKCGIIQPML